MTATLDRPPSRSVRPGAGIRVAATLPEVRWAALSLGLFLVGLVLQLAGAPAAVTWAAYLACCAAGGWEPAVAGWEALRARTLDVDLLMVLAAAGALAIGQALDAALLIVIFATSGALEAFATRRTRDAVSALTDLAPVQATLLTDGGEERVPAADLQVGDRVLVRPGDRLPADGRVVEGASEVDQASITGEPLPVDRHPGDEVYAGTVNGTGALVVRVGRPAHDSVVARIGALVEQAAETKAGTQLFVEKVEQRYAVGVVVATLAVFAVPLLLGAQLQDALLRAMTFMVVASPCALVLATMPPLLSAIATAGRRGVLVTSAVAMEGLGQVTAVVVDKTGTLTDGTPAVVATGPAPGTAEDELLALAASAEAPSEHPVGRAVVAAARQRGLALQPVTGFRAAVGRGVTGTVDGRVVAVAAADPATAPEQQERGRTVVAVTVDGAPAGWLALADRLRPEAAATVAALRGSLGRPPVLLTGDGRRAAAALAGELGITDVRAGLLPEDKVAAVRGLQAQGHRVLVVGDGVNDAPALAAADVGAAMGGVGSDLTVASADVVVVRDDLATLPALVGLSRRARRVVVQNLVLAGTVIAALVTWDLVGHLPLPLGVAGHEGSTVLVALNGLRLLRRGAWRP
ncbi:heavy metal translocating P-type ATPase [Klenkia taihuensis]|uniref:Heavy metal-(Cd/Co/Hg/Pb/Zn)-translocating P-type ATPase n=1 Tax=Klenkia taihuensis TaxID=1225127 RepID=A0A1I1HG54_9ACTN|nr:heavy metal translocating P-type ATPase [Klenkia taihuensis]GHE09293.1 metal-transporting ATPase [Klenkia taihuensis]SFC20968.1 heavy metal-(Cd/Co/Hg/Pb/Zn)-translocating P-type ATPase [Klenkia taihuensis]